MTPPPPLSRLETLIEKFAALEHEQWMRWAQTILDKEHSITQERRERWKSLMVPYGSLSEEQKLSDRKWASRVFEIIRLDIQEYGPL